MAKGKYQKWLEPEGLILLEGWARDGLTDVQIAHNMGIGIRTLYEYKEKYPQISQSLKKGKEIVDYEVENALLKAALGYETTDVIRERINDDFQKYRYKGNVALTQQEWELCQNYFGNVCCYCGADDKLTKDHVVPFTKGGEGVMENILPCCQSCNSSKNDKNMLNWYRRQSFYSKEREQKINDYLRFAPILKMALKKQDIGELVTTKEVTRFVPPNVTALIFWLKNRRPDKWRDKVENVNIGEQDSEININIMPIEKQDD